MTSAGNGRLRRYTVAASKHVGQMIEQLYVQAFSVDRGEEFLNLLRYVQQRLENDPMGFGEELYDLSAMHLRVRLAIKAPLVVGYAVHDEQPLVFIRVFKLLSLS
jgi:hypothetical protein